ncbi:hypothetical protein [Streptomyces sp. NPDC057580]|uniref:hypothetical protein n=1 Tax=Streptomyces sp. NPDC057580 TaxID=3346173 RepID=UPI0036B5D147
MTHLQPAFDGTQFTASAPAARRTVDDYDAWVSEVWSAFVAAADTGKPFTVDQVARKNKLPDPPHPQSQWGSLPRLLVNAGIMRHHDYGGSARARHSLVHIWIGIPEQQREAVARHLAEARKERAAARAEQRRAA